MTNFHPTRYQNALRQFFQ
uniref:Uncharacterized protein n=1 Tax=Arundo donax TaxID=35708 RepID=A0A0A9H659_ARUDO